MTEANLYVKLVYTCTSATIPVHPETTFDSLNSIVGPYFGITNFELVECGQSSLGMRGEDAPALVIDSSTLSSKYGRNFDVSLYIRPIQEIDLNATSSERRSDRHLQNSRGTNQITKSRRQNDSIKKNN